MKRRSCRTRDRLNGRGAKQVQIGGQVSAYLHLPWAAVVRAATVFVEKAPLRSAEAAVASCSPVRLWQPTPSCPAFATAAQNDVPECALSWSGVADLGRSRRQTRGRPWGGRWLRVGVQAGQ